MQQNSEGNVAEVARLFLKLGLTAFGGPAAHIAMMHEEVVQRRQWVTEQEFLDLLGATNLIPGPNSTELAIHLGYQRAGWRGLLTAGGCFILPAMVIVLACAWAYVRFGSLPQADWLLYGITPVIIAVVIQALWTLARRAVSTVVLGVIAAVVLGLYMAGVGEIILMLAAGLLVMLLTNGRRFLGRTAMLAPLPLATLSQSGLASSQAAAGLFPLFLVFLKVGSVLYGSGYVLLAFLQRDLVTHLEWLTNQQLLDAVAVGQFTPGPVFTTATFIGYVIGSWPGAILATIGIFLPSFIFVAAVNPLIPRLRASPWFGALLDGVNAAAVALMAGVTLILTRSAIVDGFTAALALIAAVLLLRFKINSAWLVLGGGILAVIYRAIGG